MTTATKSKPQASRLKSRASVTSDPATWPTREEYRPYVEATARLDELRDEESNLQATVRELEDQRGEYDEGALEAADVEASAAELTTQTSADNGASPRDWAVSLAKLERDLADATERLEVVGRAVELQQQIVVQQRRKAEAWIESALDKEHRRRADAVLGLLHHLYAAVQDCQEIHAWSEREGVYFCALYGLRDDSALNLLRQWQWQIARGGYLYHEGDESFAAAAELKSQIPNLDAELQAIDATRIKDQHAPDVQYDRSGAKLVAIRERSEREMQAARERYQQMLNQVGDMETQGNRAVGHALAAHREQCAATVKVS